MGTRNNQCNLMIRQSPTSFWVFAGQYANYDAATYAAALLGYNNHEHLGMYYRVLPVLV